MVRTTGDPQKVRARIRRRSERRERDMVARRRLVAQMLAEHPECQALVPYVCQRRAVDVHERLTRARGGSILDPEHGHMITVCRACHDWIGRNPALAEARRLLLPSWHSCPAVGPC